MAVSVAANRRVVSTTATEGVGFGRPGRSKIDLRLGDKQEWIRMSTAVGRMIGNRGVVDILA